MRERPQIIKVSTGGSGRGVSYYKSVLRCPRKKWLDDLVTESGKAIPSGTYITQMGTAGHGLLAKYYKDRSDFPTENLMYKTEGGRVYSLPPLAKQTAERLYRHYRLAFPPTEFSVLGVERRYEVAGGSAAWLPDDINLTGQIDLEVHYNKKQAQRASKLRNVDIAPGNYIVDHKFHWQPSPGLVNKHTTAIKERAYCLIWQLENPRKKLAGLIYNMLIGGGTPQYKTLVCPPPSVHDEKRLQALLHTAAQYLQKSPPDPHNTECTNVYTGELCQYYVSKLCMGY